jgi:hypothetical protein
MSEEGGTSVSVGFFMSYADAMRPFTFERKESSHEEDRFDAKTGKKVGTEKVVDVEEGTYVKLPTGLKAALGAFGPVRLGDGEDEDMGSPGEDGTEDFLEALGSMLGCQVESFGGEYQYVGFNAALNGDYAKDSYDPTSRMSAGPSLYLSKVMEMGERVKELSKKMKALGFKDLGKPVVYNAFMVCY